MMDDFKPVPELEEWKQKTGFKSHGDIDHERKMIRSEIEDLRSQRFDLRTEITFATEIREEAIMDEINAINSQIIALKSRLRQLAE